MCCWLETAVAALVVILLLPLFSNPRLRYYTCYINYVVTVSFFGLCLSPVFLLRPKDPSNLVIAGQILKHLTWFLGIEWEIRRDHVLKDKQRGGSIVTLNHQTIFDIMGLFNLWYALGRATVIAKQELFWVPPFGPVAWLAGLVYINRNDPKTANLQIQQASNELLKQKIHLCVFPEGTRNRDRKSLLPFKNGAFRVAIETQAPIIPVVFSPYHFIDSTNKLFHRGKIVISVLDPIETKGLTLDDIAKLKEKTYNAMSSEFFKLSEEMKNHHEH